MTHKLILLLPLLLVAAAVVSAKKRPFRSVKAPSQTVEEYEVVYPVVTYQKSDGNTSYPSKMTIKIPTEAGTFVLSLTKNKKFLPDKFTSICADGDGNRVADRHHYDNCYYQGRVKGHLNWIATMSTCHGLQGEFGDLSDPENLYNIEPLSKLSSSLIEGHHLYLESEYSYKAGSCGMTHDDKIHKRASNTDDKKEKVRRQAIEKTERIVEWTIVNDYAQFQSFDNLEETVERALAIANGVDLLYRPLGIRVVVVNVITFTDGNPFPVNTEIPSSILYEFTESYVQGVLIPNDVEFDSAMLLIGTEDEYGVLGVAFLGTMCSRTNATAYTRDGGGSIGQVISTAAHELGHVFNMKHDNTLPRNCTCDAVNGSSCVMQSYLSYPAPTIFSSCSVSDLNDLYSQGGDFCLFNDPTTDPICGNGIVEDGETCDSGPAEIRTNMCCNMTTCQPIAGAECVTGQCCTDQCMLAPYGTKCRVPVNDCDIAEFCFGDSTECPADVIKADGASCHSGTGYCQNGECPTHEAQCNHIFSDSRVGNPSCYDLNTRGDIYGFCTQNSSSTYQPCDISDTLCGKLQCQGGNYKYNQFVPVNITTFTVSNDTCRSISLRGVPYSPEELNTGTVLDGTKCGDGKVCAARKCVPLSAPASCPHGDNGQECSGPTNGVCTSQQECFCNVGFKGIACESLVAPNVNECLVDNGGCNETCTDTVGWFECSCDTPGFTLSSDNRHCEDADECSVNNGGCDGTCTNEVGSFQCSCGSGFTLDADGRTCNDIDECLTDNGGCEQECINYAGSYYCLCSSGYITDSDDGKSCIDYDECAYGNGGCSQICNNTIGSYECSCYDGFHLGTNDHTCISDGANESLCSSAGLDPGCCIDSCFVGHCFCDELCHTYQDCCSDVPPMSELNCSWIPSNSSASNLFNIS